MNKQKKIIATEISLICVLFALVILSCDHSPVGSDQLDRALAEPASHEFYPPASACYSKYVPNGANSSLILGKNSEYESRALLMFPLIDSALESVTEARLVLYTKRQANINFNVHIVLENWKENAVTWERTDSASYWFCDSFCPGANFSETSIGISQIAEESTVVILNHIDSLVRNGHGIILIPQDTGFGFFYSVETSKDPKIIFKYPEKELSFTCSGDASIINTVDLHLERNDLWVGAGYAFHTYLKFNTDTIPDEATITNAELTLHPDTAFLLPDTVEIGVHRLFEPYQELVSPKFNPNISGKARFTNSDTVIRIDLRSLVQFWSLNRDSNFGFVITAHPDYYDIFRIELKRDFALRPLVKVGYILPPKGRF
jgi:hypothetical protein